MLTYLHIDFLKNDRAYALAERYWIDLWHRIDRTSREAHGWRHPWFAPLPRELSEGNPIFSAASPMLRRGIRVIQSEPTEPGLEIVAYPDTFGGSIDDPSRIHELVISCALSDAAADCALGLMTPWVVGESIPFDRDRESGFLRLTDATKSA